MALPTLPRYRETGLSFACRGDTLVGVIAQPAAAAVSNGTGVVVVVGGPQYRAGSHRQFTLLARELAAAGSPTLRFDVRGMGDSEGQARNFEELSDDIGSAIDALRAADGSVRQVVLWGLCDGASAAWLYIHERNDPRIAGLFLVNPWVRSESSLARTHVKHYYAQRLLAPAFWRKLLAGQVGAGAVRGLWRSLLTMFNGSRDCAQQGVSPADFRLRMERACIRFEGETLLALSAEDFTAKEFIEHLESRPTWKQAIRRPATQVRTFAGADHTFSDPTLDRQLRAAMIEWLPRVGARRASPTP